RRSRSTSARSCATSTRSSTTRTEAHGRRTCRATPFRRRPEPTAPSCSMPTARSSPIRSARAMPSARRSSRRSRKAKASRRPPGGQSRFGESERMSTITIIELEAAVEDAAAHLYVWALKDIPQDLREALADAATRETSVPGQRVLQTILKNVNVAESEKNLVCQDTGIAVYTCRVGEHFPLHPARIYAALKAGTERATI